MSICGLEGGGDKLGGGLVSDLCVCVHECLLGGLNGGIHVAYVNKLLLRYYIYYDGI